MKYIVIVICLWMTSRPFVAAQSAATSFLPLNEAIALAKAHNKSLQSTSLGNKRAVERTKIVKSELLPSLYLESNVQHYFQEGLFFGFGDQTGSKIGYGRFGGKDLSNVSLNIDYPVYSPTAKARLQKSVVEQEKESLLYTKTEVDIVAEVKQAYLRLIILKKRLKLQNESLARNGQVLKDSRVLLAQGKALRIDTLRAYTNFKNLEPDLNKIQNSLTIGSMTLSVLVGQDITSATLSDTLLFDGDTVLSIEDDLFEYAKNNRPEIRLLAMEKQLTTHTIAIAKKNKLPTVTAFGQYIIQSQANSFKYAQAYWPSVSYVGVNVYVPLFTGFKNRSTIDEARISHNQAQLDYDYSLDQLKVSLKNILSALEESKHRIETQKDVVKTAKMSYDNSLYRYKNGVATRLELVDAELGLSTAQSNLLEGIYSYLSAQIELERLKGDRM